MPTSVIYLAMHMIIGTVPLNLLILWIAWVGKYEFIKQTRYVLYVQLVLIPIIILIGLNEY